MNNIKELKLKNLVIASPDIGGSKRANVYAKHLKCEMVICYKQRKKANVVDKIKIIGNVENKDVVIIDDVLYTGRSVRSAIDALMPFGRPNSIELLVFVDRRLKRHLPIQPDYTGKIIDSIDSEKVVVNVEKNNEIKNVLILKSKNE
jgi:pyrimidine operon attenuation protein/uracil phosphoribosyltransferase